MNKSVLHVLCVEDDASDADLLKAHLELREFDVVLQRVETEPEFLAALQNDIWDVVLADYSLPQFNAARSLEILRASNIDLPFIVVSGTIGEERAIEMMRGGANDFVLKGDFKRLVPAIRRELTEADNRQARRSAERALAQSEASFKQLADSMPLLVWTLANDGSMLSANSRWFAYSGLSEAETLGWGWTSIIDPSQAEQVISHFRSSIAAGKEFSSEQCLRGADGTYRWFLARATPAVGSSGEIERWYATATDIHEQKQAADELRRAKLAAEQANEAKSQFLANMSHEIRTPLGAILGFADLMADPNQTLNDRLDCISTIKRNGDQLSKIINEILDLSKVESEKLEIEKVEFDLSELIGDIASFLGPTAQQKGLKLNAICENSLPRNVKSDPTRLRQILLNVIGNAIKFTDNGEITLRVQSHSAHENQKISKIDFLVSDSGIGISQEQARRLFRPFVQGDASMTRKHGGTGLGLALSRKLAHALGGTVDLVDSQPGKGSTFKCEITVEVLDSQTFSTHSENQSVSVNAKVQNALHAGTTLAGKRVLLVEDAPDNRILISRYLTRVGANVDTEENGLTGVKRTLTESYDVVLMDIQMPVMDGFTAIKELRSNGYPGPVIALTAHAMSGYRERCIEAGFTEHLSKPVDRDALISLIKRM